MARSAPPNPALIPTEPERPFYTLLRGVHLLVSASLIPLALYAYFGGLQAWHAAAASVALFVAPILILFLVPMDQAAYPLRVSEALVRTAPLAMNFGISFLAERDGPRAAFLTVGAALAGLALILAYGVAVESRGKDEKRAWKILVPIFGLALIGALAVVPPTFQMAMALDGWGRLGVFASWLLHAFSTAQAFHRRSVWTRDPDRATDVYFMTRWGGPTALVLAVAFTAAVVVIFSQGFR